MSVQSLTKTQDFERVMAGGKRARRGCARVFAVRSIDLEPGSGKRLSRPSRLGVAMSAGKGAVVRNRGKRRIRAAFRDYDPASGYDIVIKSDERAATSSWPELTADVGAALRGADVRTNRG